MTYLITFACYGGHLRWARHGSTRWLWKPQHIAAAIQYVVAEQGDAMSVFEAQELS